MKRFFKSIFVVSLLFFVLILILRYPDIAIDSVLDGINIWMYNILPALFPFFILSDLLINYGFVEILSELFKNFMSIFGLSGNSSFILFGSIISGSPSGAKLTKQLLEDESITLDEANHLIRFTHFSNPLFIIGVVGNVLLNDIRVGYLIFISLVLGNFIIGIIFRCKNVFDNKKVLLNNIVESINKKNNTNKSSFINILSKSIYDSFDILFLILGIVIIFITLSNLLSIFNINNNLLIFIKGILEMTYGIKMVSISNFNFLIKTSLITFFLAFGGLSIHLQVSSIISNTKIKYKNFLVSRIIHSILSSILVFILIYLFW